MHKKSKVQMGGTHAWSPGDKIVFFCRAPIQSAAAQSMVVSWQQYFSKRAEGSIWGSTVEAWPWGMRTAWLPQRFASTLKGERDFAAPGFKSWQRLLPAALQYPLKKGSMIKAHPSVPYNQQLTTTRKAAIGSPPPPRFYYPASLCVGSKEQMSSLCLPPPFAHRKR